MRLVSDETYSKDGIELTQKLYSKAIQLAKNNCEKLYRIARFYRFDRERRHEFQALAFQLYTEAAKSKHVASLRELSEMHRKGIGCDVDLDKAFKYARYLAKSGDTWGQKTVAAHYLNGDGTLYDPEYATYWWKRAALKGDPWSAFQLGESYYLGEGASLNIKAASQWYQSAYTRGVTQAKDRLEQIKKIKKRS